MYAPFRPYDTKVPVKGMIPFARLPPQPVNLFPVLWVNQIAPLCVRDSRAIRRQTEKLSVVSGDSDHVCFNIAVPHAKPGSVLRQPKTFLAIAKGRLGPFAVGDVV